MSYLKVNFDDSKPTFEDVDLPEDVPSFVDRCHSLLSCNSIEIVSTVLRGVVLIIDEESKLKPDWLYRVNRVASLLYGSSSDCIVGDALLARIDGPNLLPLDSSDIYRLRKNFPY